MIYDMPAAGMILVWYARYDMVWYVMVWYDTRYDMVVIGRILGRPRIISCSRSYNH